MFNIFNVFCYLLIRKKYNSQSWAVNHEVLPLFVINDEIQSILLSLHFACLAEENGLKILIISLFPSSEEIRNLAEIICPKIKIIDGKSSFISFVERQVFRFFLPSKLYIEIYTYFRFLRANSITLFEPSSTITNSKLVSCYNKYLDPNLKNINEKHTPFILSYIQYRKESLIHSEHWNRYFLFAKRSPLLANVMKETSTLQKEKSLSSLSHYVLVDLQSNQLQFPERLSASIDYLITQGWNVVILQAKKAPLLLPRKKLKLYYLSEKPSLKEILPLYQSSSFVISMKSPLDGFALVCDLPILWLNFTQLSYIIPNRRARFYPQHIYDMQNARNIFWKEALQHPSFFHSFNQSSPLDYQLKEMSEDELLSAVQEFVALVPQPLESWFKLTNLQSEFKATLTPLHMDLYHSEATPCDCFLKS